MRELRSVCAVLLVSSLVAMGCLPASHRVRTMDVRRAPRAEACVAASLPTYADHGPDRAHVAFAVVTAECREAKEEQCREQLLQGGCEANADALIDITTHVSQARRRMVGTAIEYTADAPPAAPSVDDAH